MRPTNIDDIEFAILDTETTGLQPDNGDRIIEIACVKLKGNDITGKFSTLIDPQRSIPEEAARVHHISNEMLRGSPLMKDVMPEFLSFIKGCVLCAYNAPFDIGFINRELKLLGEELASDATIIDILIMARKMLPNMERYSLGFVAERMGIECEQVHRALSDVYISIEVFKRLREIFKSKGLYDFVSFNTLFGLNSPRLEDIRSQKISRIQEAIDLRVRLKMKYLANSSAQVTEREVEPKLIKQENKRFYMVGYCDLRKEERTFAVDGILHLEIV